MYVLNAEIEDKKTLDTLKEMMKLLGIVSNSFKLEEYYQEIEEAQNEIKKGNFTNISDIKNTIKKK